MKIAEDNKVKAVKVTFSVAALSVLGVGIGGYYSLPFLGAALGATLGAWLGAWITHKHVKVRETSDSDLEALNSYTEGKMHRYNLLFAVNGGAFAVGGFLLQPSANPLLKVFPIEYLAQGAIVFTAVMTVDIWLFGQMMREKFVGDGAFTAPGKTLLLIICVLLIAGWAIVLRHHSLVCG
jgi:hypothetical protein